eukprot:SAG11_NODE_1806_length_4228_cov_6.096391_4_plen_75_part_00
MCKNGGLSPIVGRDANLLRVVLVISNVVLDTVALVEVGVVPINLTVHAIELAELIELVFIIIKDGQGRLILSQN